MSFDTAQTLLLSICAAAADDGGDAGSLAASSGLTAQDAPSLVRPVLPEGAKVWGVAATDAQVLLYVYGPAGAGCGAVIARPLDVKLVGDRLKAALVATESRFERISEETMDQGVVFTRFRSAEGRYIDVLEFPERNGTPGLVKAEFLAG